MEVDSPRHMSPSDQLAECPDSTCAQVIHSNAEITGSRRVPVTAAKECQDHEERCGMRYLDLHGFVQDGLNIFVVVSLFCCLSIFCFMLFLSLNIFAFLSFRKFCKTQQRPGCRWPKKSRFTT